MGTVVIRTSVQLTAWVDGTVTAIEVPDEARVEPGQVVVRLGGPLVAARRARLEADVQSLRSRFALADARARELERVFKAKLATKDRLVVAKERRLDLEGRLRGARLALDAFAGLTGTTSPRAGVFSHRQVSTGQTVRAGQVLGEIVDVDRLRILATLRPPPGTPLVDRPVNVHLDLGAPITGAVQCVLPRADPDGALQVWIGGPQIDERLRPGQTVHGEVVLTSRSAPAVPVGAVVYDAQEKAYVFVHDERGDHRRPVALGVTEDGWIEVLSGLDAGERVVTQGAYELFYRDFKKQFRVAD